MGRIYLERYEIDREIGRGGMAVVYRGVDLTLGRPVAVKVMHPHLLKRQDARDRFCREARVIAKLRHENIVEVYDYSGGDTPATSDIEDALIVTELIEGISFSEYLALHGPLLPEMAAVVTAVVAGALEHAHVNGVVHRDVKPENIMVGPTGALKLMDFGIAHVIDMEHLTVTGAIVGSPAHMSPEQVDGRALDARTDIFSLGTLLFLLSSGTLPFSSDTPSGLLRAISEAHVPDIRARVRGFPDDLHAILMKMMAREPDRRFQSAAEVRTAIESALVGLGLSDLKAEMARFFGSPTVEAVKIRRRVCLARVALARQHLAAGRRARALREADTASLMDPECDEAVRLLSQVRRSVRSGNIFRLVAICCLAGAVIGGGFLLWHFNRGERWKYPELRTGEGVSIVRRPADHLALTRRGPEAGFFRQDAVQVRLRPGSGQRNEQGGRTEILDNGVEKRAQFPVSIHAYPPAVQIRVDGKQVGVGRVEGLMLDAGSHQVGLSHPSCDECRDVSSVVVIDPANPPRAPLRVSIGYREARLTVSGPAGGDVFVNNESAPRGKTNSLILIPVDRPGLQDFSVKVYVDGTVRYSGAVKIQAGKSATIRIN